MHAGSGAPDRRSAAETCTRQPGFALAYTSGSAARTCWPCARPARAPRPAARGCRYPRCRSRSPARPARPVRALGSSRVARAARRGSPARVPGGTRPGRRRAARAVALGPGSSASSSRRRRPARQPRLLQVRPAAGSVDDDRVDAARTSSASARAPLSLLARPAWRCSAPQQPWPPARPPRALRRQHPGRGRVHVAEDDALDAAGEQPHAAALPHGRRHLRRPHGRAPRRRELASDRATRQRHARRSDSSAARSRRGYGKTAKTSDPQEPVVAGRSYCSSTSSRVCSISRS